METRFRIIRYGIWALSAFVLIAGLAFIRDPRLSPTLQACVVLLIEAGGAFFFALTVVWVIDKLRDAEGYSTLWQFSQEFRKAGILDFYSDRKEYAEQALEQAFEKHRGGQVLMAGASLRLFLAPGLHFYSWVQGILARKGSSPIVVRALSCNPEGNYELPVRSFVEEFNQDRSFPKDSPFDWNRAIDFDFEEFEEDFFQERGIDALSSQRVRVIHDLGSTRAGVKELQGVSRGVGNHLYHREFRFAPYCTVIIFPDKAFYTPNLLCTKVPVNMPMIVFHRTSDVYAKLVNYVEFLWWVSGYEGEERSV